MKVYNSLTRKKEDLVLKQDGKVGMYVCGPTVYDEPHIGHARSAYIFDVIRRYFQYKGYDVTFVRNVTDVDDKIINKARQEFKGEYIDLAANKVATKYLDSYHGYMRKLGLQDPTHEPKATEYIQKMQGFIQDLIARGAAYPSDGDVYFDIRKAANYGKLSNQNLKNMEIGARIAPGEKKRDPLDFALWKKAKDDEPSWQSPWGKGRPGWHIECSVMSSDILGDEFDIHGGGIDLIFPHHENEVAQSEGAGKKFARYWIHNGLLTINSEKMAKSLGNYITIEDFLKKHKKADYLKLLFLTTHYRHPVDYTEEKIEEMKKERERFSVLLKKLMLISDGKSVVERELDEIVIDNELQKFRGDFEAAMDDDFNTPMAVATLFAVVLYCNKLIHHKEVFTDVEKETLVGAAWLLKKLGSVLGLDLAIEESDEAADEGVKKLIEMRNEARKSKDFKAADDIRKKLTDMGIVLEDTKDGRTGWRRKD